MLAAVSAAIAEVTEAIITTVEARIDQDLLARIDVDIEVDRRFATEHPLRLCRVIQAVDGVNHFVGEFDRPRAKFGSGYAALTLADRETINPANTTRAQLGELTRALDSAAAEFIADPRKLQRITPRRFEELVAEVYRAHGFDVDLQGGPRDHGIDLVAVLRAPVQAPKGVAQHFRIAIQVKRYHREHRVPERAVRDLVGVVAADGFDRGILVSTSSLTANARDYLSSRRPVQDQIQVAAGDQFLELLVSYCRERLVPFWGTHPVPKRKR